MSAETGGTRQWGEYNCRLAANVLREAASMTTQVTGEIIPSDKPGTLSMAIRQPVGVLVGMAPWNAPVILAVRALALPIACGNTVVLKASEMCPATHRLIGKVLTDSGLPKGVVNVVTGYGHEMGEALVSHPLVERIAFTGGPEAGRIINEQAARSMKRVTLELGGKSPNIVFDDADLDQAVKGAVAGIFAASASARRLALRAESSGASSSDTSALAAGRRGARQGRGARATRWSWTPVPLSTPVGERKNRKTDIQGGSVPRACSIFASSMAYSMSTSTTTGHRARSYSRSACSDCTDAQARPADCMRPGSG